MREMFKKRKNNTMKLEISDNAKLWLMLSCLAMVVVYSILLRHIGRNEVIENFEATEGRIITYKDRGYSDAGSGRTIGYSYVVKGITYHRNLYTGIKFEDCGNIEMKKSCKDRRFWVIYSKKDVTKSLINLKMEIQGINNPEFPRSIKDFF
jgi:hypothetical protein